MDLNTITTANFQSQFFRDFPYLPTWDSTVTYAADAQSYYNGSFWRALINGLLNIVPGSDSSKWQQITANPLDYVQPQDITNAFAQAQVVFNQSLFGDDASTTMAYLYCTAHYLVHDLRSAMQGINGVGTFAVASRGVGSMNETYAIPDIIKDTAHLSFFTTSTYGMKYLSLLMPNLIGNVASVNGGTNP